MFNIKTKYSFLNLIDEIKKAIELDLYNCALALTLTLPDILNSSDKNKFDVSEIRIDT